MQLKGKELCMIDIQHLHKTYGNAKKANDDITLQIYPGEIFGLLGPNGSGKSTLFKQMTGIIQPDYGDVILNGHSIVSDSLEAKKTFAFVSDTPDNFLQLKGIEYLNFVANIYQVPNKEKAQRIESTAREFGMYDDLGKQIASYSHGMRQKIMVIGALVVNPDIWILDEPMVGLDPRSAFNLKNKMREHADKDNIVIFSTHVLEVAEQIVDRLAIINKGHLVFVGTVDQLREMNHSDKSLEQIFLELTDTEGENPLSQEKLDAAQGV